MLDGSSCDPSSTSDWPGWTRVMGLGGCCPADVAPDPASALPPWQWGPCSNGAPGCVELAHDWPMQSPPYGLDGRQLVAFATDGVHLFWSEAYGNPTPATQQPNVEVWAAPYTSDPTTLASTAGKVTTLAGGATPGLAAAFQGLYAVAPNPFATAYVVRLLDGAVQAVQAGPGWIFQQVLLVSGGELWAVMAQNPGLRGFALARYSLADW